MAILLVYVDDIILTGKSTTELHKIQQLLHKTFQVKDLGSLRYFLGFEIARTNKGISINQGKYTLEIVSDAGLLGYKLAPTLMLHGTHLFQDSSTPYQDAPAYRRMIGRLIYLTNTMPNISFTVNQLAQFMTTPTTMHHVAAIRVIKYIKGTPALGLFYPASSTLHIKAYNDSDWTSCPNIKDLFPDIAST
ncbi:PREDICTED: uncharacterized protein LOC109337657 [Lupinus angustifolius]|uniref:uncharacterized protein LOC109337657 n=1 Tax=Lupinus angustifolius TaxID=3871 RepID=UPI00092E6C5C|nr:PREDICTED: uncharacterized protein LOC109337657 [Lupinus angustifolius]